MRRALWWQTGQVAGEVRRTRMRRALWWQTGQAAGEVRRTRMRRALWWQTGQVAGEVRRTRMRRALWWQTQTLLHRLTARSNSSPFMIGGIHRKLHYKKKANGVP